MSTYAIGDIQGCYEAFQRLLDTIAFDPAKDTLWLAGDLINRGPDSLSTMRLILSLQDNIVAILGNHDLHFLAASHNLRSLSRSDTLSELLNADDCYEFVEWLSHCPLLHHDKELGYAMVHAGIPPQWTLKQAKRYAREVEAVLQSDKRFRFYREMYGNEPSQWHDDLNGMARLRLITNYFTRMRFCSASGVLDLSNKQATSSDNRMKPWFEHPERLTAHKRIVFGHWAALEGQCSAANAFALDTGCVWGGSLTAMRLEDQQLFSHNCRLK